MVETSQEEVAALKDWERRANGRLKVLERRTACATAGQYSLAGEALCKSCPAGKYKAGEDAEPTVGKWSCCGATEQGAPGCYFTHHEPGDKMNF